MNTKNYKQSVFEFIDGHTPSFIVVHNASPVKIEKDVIRWYKQTFSYTVESFIKYTFLKPYRAFSKIDFDKLNKK